MWRLGVKISLLWVFLQGSSVSGQSQAKSSNAVAAKLGNEQKAAFNATEEIEENAYLPCKAGFHLYEDTCFPCSPHCLTCFDSSHCQECEADYQLHASLYTCLLSSRRLGAEGCGLNCRVCVEPGVCEACEEGHSQDGRGPDCDLGVLGCPVQKYREEGTGFCQDCPNLCLSCSDASTCLACRENAQMKDQSTPICSNDPCKEPLRRNSAGICILCGTNCKFCDTADVCEVCEDEYAQNSPPGPDCLLTQCTEHQYRAAETGYCQECSSTCQSCTETLCSACAKDYYQMFPGSICDLETCPSAYYVDNTNFCLKCGEGCSICSASTCSKCLDGYTTLVANAPNCQNTACVSGYYRKESGLCVQCGEHCAVCSAASSCIACEAGFFDLPTSTGACNLTSCPTSTYTASGNHCLDCGSHCEICSNDSSCQRCRENYQQGSESLKDCSDLQCVSPMFRDVNGHCMALGDHCAASSLIGTCDLCETDYYRISGNSCDLTICPEGMYGDSQGRCWTCGEGCKQCTTERDCQACQSLTAHISSSGVCVEDTTCSLGSWKGEEGCQLCGVSCEECQNGSSCLICAQNYQQTNPPSPDCSPDPCTSPLTRDLFGYCVSCNDESCSQCGITAKSELYCKTCLEEYQRDRIESPCVALKCQAGSYRDENGVCKVCGKGCESCLHADSCEKCLIHYLQQSWPLRDCTPGDVCTEKLYRDVNGHCQPCGAHCQVCTEATSCDICDQEHYQEDMRESGDCSSTPCSSGNFPDPVSGHCTPCGSGCLLCGPSICFQCESGLVQTDLSGNACTPGPCPIQTYKEAESYRCLPCGLGCLACTPNSCSKCDLGYMQIDRLTNSCVQGTCPDGSYQESESNHCLKCGENCEICVDSESCSVCKSGFQMQVGEIAPNCDLQPCKLREYRDSSGHCQGCGENCWNCSEGQSCTACDSGFYQEDPDSMKNCSSENCSDGKYPHQTSGHCLKCGENCAICHNAISCFRCEETFQQQTTINSPNCSPIPCEVFTYRDLNGHCQFCGNNCLSCSIEKFCQNCSDQSIRLTNEDKTCEIGACSEGFYRDSTGLCVVCGKHCLICRNQASCELCEDEYQQQSLDMAICSSLPCEKGTYRLSNGHCTVCGANCIQCNDTNTCVYCAPLYYQDDNSDHSGCLDRSCAVGKYPADNGLCTLCGIGCFACESAVACLTCLKPDTDAPLSGTNTCVPANCHINQYWTGTECAVCNLYCASCSQESGLCSACSGSYFPESRLPGLCTNQCAVSCQSCARVASLCTTCSAGYIPEDTLPGLCTAACENSCKTCRISATVCEECTDGYLIETILPGRCVSNPDKSCKSATNSALICSVCSEGYQPYTTLPGRCVAKGSCHPSCKDASSCEGAYTACTACASNYLSSGDICTFAVCHQSCNTCNGPSYNNCVSCAEGNTFIPALNICQLKVCSGSCNTCYGSAPDQCLSCKAHSSKSPTSDYCGCDMFYTLSSSIDTCVYAGACDAKCLTCSGPSAPDCLSCVSNAERVEQGCACKDGYIWSGSVCRYTGECVSECAVCSGPEPNQCVSCPLNATLRSGSCVCNSNYQWNLRESMCKYTGMCSAMCSLCNGPGEHDCTACIDPTTSHLSDSTCACLQDYIWSSNTKTCQYSGLCAEAFSTCTGPTKAQGTFCDPNAHKEETDCQCNTNFAWDFTLGKCLASSCDSVCLTCTGPSKRQCASCNDQNHHSISSGTCICGDGYFGSITSTSDLCIPCHTSCRQCSDTASNKCLICYEKASITSLSTCECDVGYFLDREIERCVACHPLCKACTGALETECQSCRADFTLTEEQTCACLPSFSLNLETLDCDKCHSTCASCLGPANTQCKSCAAGQTLLNNACVCTQDGKYNNAGTCSDCYDGCRTCTSPRSDQCLSCYSEAVLFSSPGPSSCICLSPKRPAPTPQTCSLCPSSCADCSQADANFCTACKSHAIPSLAAFPSACICETGYYWASSAACVPCHSTCQTCVSASPFFCSGCVGYGNEGGLFCESYCPSGFNGVQGVCVIAAPLVFSLSFDRLNSYKDTVNNYEVVASSPLKVLYRQGIQLLGQQFLQLPPNSKSPGQLVLSSNHYAEIWLRPSASPTPQTILSKYIDDTQLILLSISDGVLKLTVLTYYFEVSGDTVIGKLHQSDSAKSEKTITGGSVSSEKEWIRVGYSVALSGKSTTLAIYLASVTVVVYTFEGVFFRDFNEGVFLLGGQTTDLTSSTFFKGGLAEVRIFNNQSTLPVLTNCPAPCPSACSSSGLCLIPCANSEFLSPTGVCLPCNATCGNNGCVRASDCSLNQDPLCQSYTDFTGCTGCVALAVADSQGICTCVSDSTYNAAASACVCAKSGFQVFNKQCVSCLAYFKSGDVSAVFDYDYMKVYVHFAKSVKIGVEGCTNIFGFNTVGKLGTSPNCGFDANRRKLTILLGLGTTLVQEELEINSKVVLSSEAECSFEAETLRPVAQYPGEPLVPTAIIMMSAQYSTVCGGKGLDVSGAGSSGAQGRPMLYRWTFESDVEMVAISGYSNYSADNVRITIPNSSLQTSTLKVTLSIKNFFGLENAITKSVQISTVPGLAVLIDGGDQVSMKAATRRLLKATVKSACGLSSPTIEYSWTVRKGNIAVGLDLTGNPLVIPANSLSVGTTYELQVTATDSTGISGTALVTITATASPLKVLCNRSSGDQSISQDLVIDCSQSRDTDYPTAMDIKASWTCVQGTEKCLSALGGTLPLTTGLILRIPKAQLLSGVTYVLSLTISKDSRSDSATLAIATVGATDLQVSIAFESRFYSPKEDIQVLSSVQGADSAQVACQWTQKSGQTLVPRSRPDATFLSLPAGSTLSGQTYTFVLTATVQSGAVAASVTILMSWPPAGGRAGVEPAAGLALVQEFTVWQRGWVAQDLPLLASVSYLEHSRKRGLLVPSQANERGTRLFAGSLALLIEICDALDSCTIVNSPVLVTSPSRTLANTDFQATFQQLTVDRDQIPSICVVFGKSIVLEQDLWTFIVSKLTQFSADLSDISAETLNAELNCVQVLASIQTLQNQANLAVLLNTTSDILSKYKGSIHSEAFQTLVGLFSGFPQTSTLLNEYYSGLQSSYLDSFLPDDDPVVTNSAAIGLFLARKTASNLAFTVNSPLLNFTLATPSTLAADLSLSPATVVDFTVQQYLKPSFPAGIIDINVLKVGTYGLIFTKNASKSPLKVTNLTEPINITLPVLDYQPQEQYQCVYMGEKEWQTAGCRVLNMTNATASIQIWHFSAFTVVTKEMKGFEPEGMPHFSQKLQYECEMWLAPVYTMIAIVVVSLGLLAVLCTAGLLCPPKPSEEAAQFSSREGFKSEDPGFSPPTESAPLASQTPMQNPEPKDLPLGVFRPMGDIASAHDVDVHLDSPVFTPVNLAAPPPATRSRRVHRPKVTPLVSFLEGHYLIGLFLARQWPRWEKLLCLMTVLLCDLFFLGVFYYFLQESTVEGEETEDSFLWSEYTSQDARFYLYSFLLSVPVSIIAAGLFISAELQVRAERRRTLLGLGVGFCLLAAGVFVVLIASMNAELCYEYAGRWCIGFLWCVVTELGAVEFLLAAGRWALLKIYQSA